MVMLKIAVFAFVALVFIGLGVSGSLNAAISGYHKVESNPTVQNLQQKAVNAVKSEASTQIHNLENATTNAIDQKINQVVGVSP